MVDALTLWRMSTQSMAMNIVPVGECGYYKGCEDCALAGTEHCNKAPTGGGKDGTE